MDTHDHAGFLFHHCSNMVVRGGFPPVPVSIMVVAGGYPLPRHEPVQSFWSNGYLLWLGRRPCIMAPSGAFPAKSLFLNYMSWKIGSSYYWVYAIYFLALVQSNRESREL
ncbi:hypothetical protein QL285_022295 [Trifolium repens]|nr:hypothetical protein QL285_022295 [Trifolium repens]